MGTKWWATEAALKCKCSFSFMSRSLSLKDIRFMCCKNKTTTTKLHLWGGGKEKQNWNHMFRTKLLQLSQMVCHTVFSELSQISILLMTSWN